MGEERAAQQLHYIPCKFVYKKEKYQYTETCAILYLITLNVFVCIQFLHFICTAAFSMEAERSFKLRNGTINKKLNYCNFEFNGSHTVQTLFFQVCISHCYNSLQMS